MLSSTLRGSPRWLSAGAFKMRGKITRAEAEDAAGAAPALGQRGLPRLPVPKFRFPTSGNLFSPPRETFPLGAYALRLEIRGIIQ